MYQRYLTPPEPPEEPSPTKLIQVTTGGECRSMDGAVDRKGQVIDLVLYQFYTEIMGKTHQDVMEYHGYYDSDPVSYDDEDDDDYVDDDYDDECEPLFVMLTVTLDQLKGFARLFNVPEDSVSVHVETSYDSGPTRAYIQGTCIKTEEELEAERQALRTKYEAEMQRYEQRQNAYNARKTKVSITS